MACDTVFSEPNVDFYSRKLADKNVRGRRESEKGRRSWSQITAVRDLGLGEGFGGPLSMWQVGVRFNAIEARGSSLELR